VNCRLSSGTVFTQALTGITTPVTDNPLCAVYSSSTHNTLFTFLKNDSCKAALIFLDEFSFPSPA
jgi:molybdopterin-guanine dinucleotide biosynthesis protein A